MRYIYNFIIAVMLLSSCSIRNSRQATGTMVGLQLGTIVGGAVGGVSSHSQYGHLMGTAIGAITGAAVGNAINQPEEQGAKQPSQNNTGNKDAKRDAGRAKIEQIVAQTSKNGNIIVRNVAFANSDGGRRLAAGGYAKLSFEIYNFGEHTVDVFPLLECSNSNIVFSEMTPVQKLLPKEGVSYSVSVHGSDVLDSGSCDILISLAVDNSEYFAVHKLKIITENK